VLGRSIFGVRSPAFSESSATERSPRTS